MCLPLQLLVSYKSSIYVDVEVGLYLCESVWSSNSHDVRWPWWGSMLWFEQWMECWRRLIPSWPVVLKPAKDQILGVDTSGQHVTPHVRYGTPYWLIRKALVSLSCWMSGTGMAIPTRPQGARGACGYSIIPNTRKPYQLWKGPEGILLYPIRGNLWQSKTYDLGLTFLKACSDILASHHGSVIVLGRHGNMEVL
jgi:hypothetical protein